jgi:antitoxin (DNA-binding transcriptional repressor) of toxin-antitoxin stability system
MAELHLSALELARNLSELLVKVRDGIEIIVEQDRQPVAVLKSVAPPRRTLTQVLALTPENSSAVMDIDFARDVQAAIDAHRESLDSTLWD